MDFDVVVIGAGLAGSVAARELALHGRRVMLVDRRSGTRHKVCGCCLNANALDTIDRIGLMPQLMALGPRPLERLRVACGGRSQSLPLPRGLSISRNVLDRMLIDAAKAAGVKFLSGTTAQVISNVDEVDRELIRVQIGPDRCLTASCVIAADGLGGTSLKRVAGFETVTSDQSRRGIGGHLSVSLTDAVSVQPGEIVMACGQYGYVGGVHLEDGSIDFAAAVDDALIKTNGVRDAVLQIVSESRMELPVGLVERWSVTPTLTRHRSRIAGQRILVVGDAAGYVEPFTGEGMAWALAGGHAVAAVADQALSEGWSKQIEQAWQQAYRKTVAKRMVGCRAVAALLRRPRLTKTTLRLLQFMPGLSNRVIQHIARPQRSAPRPAGLIAKLAPAPAR
jgi:flavin-dependent dehydrogenase